MLGLTLREKFHWSLDSPCWTWVRAVTLEGTSVSVGDAALPCWLGGGRYTAGRWGTGLGLIQSSPMKQQSSVTPCIRSWNLKLVALTAPAIRTYIHPFSKYLSAVYYMWGFLLGAITRLLGSMKSNLENKHQSNGDFLRVVMILQLNGLQWSFFFSLNSFAVRWRVCSSAQSWCLDNPE